MDDHEAEVEAAYQARVADDPMLFFRGLVIPGDTGARLFDDCMADFQVATFNDLNPSLIAVRDGKMPPISRFWIERTKKAGKDSDIAAALLWLVAFARRPLYMQVGAADADQAAIVKRRIHDLLFYNPWLNDYVQIKQNKVVGTNGLGVLEIIAADVAGSHGETPDVLVVNELSHITKWEFVENLLDNADGVPQGMVILATNAGFKGSKAAVLRDAAIKQNWCCHILSRPAPWHTQAALDNARARSTLSRFNRLWWGKWASGKGDAISEADIDRIFKPELRPPNGPETGWTYIAGLDLGVSHDHAGLMVAGVHPGRQVIRAAVMRGFEPARGTGEVDLIAVEDAVLAAFRTFRLVWVGYDPYQAVLMAQRLRLKRVPMQPVSFTGGNINTMATSMVEVLSNGKFEAWEETDGRLRRDLGRMSIIERPYGYKLEATRDEYGHADVGTGLAILLPQALNILASGGWGSLGPDDAIDVENDDPLSAAEEAAMPDELREIYDGEAAVAQETRRVWINDLDSLV